MYDSFFFSVRVENEDSETSTETVKANLKTKLRARQGETDGLFLTLPKHIDKNLLIVNAWVGDCLL